MVVVHGKVLKAKEVKDGQFISFDLYDDGHLYSVMGKTEDFKGKLVINKETNVRVIPKVRNGFINYWGLNTIE